MLRVLARTLELDTRLAVATISPNLPAFVERTLECAGPAPNCIFLGAHVVEKECLVHSAQHR